MYMHASHLVDSVLRNVASCGAQLPILSRGISYERKVGNFWDFAKFVKYVASNLYSCTSS